MTGRLCPLWVKSGHKVNGRGDAFWELTCRIIARGADLLGIAIANFVTFLAMDTVIIGGGITEALGERYLDLIRKAFERDVFPARCRDCRIVATKLKADAGLLGAALLARDASR